MKKHEKIKKFYQVLYKHFGSQNWWPGETPIEIAIGAILTQNTAWTNVEKAIANLKRHKVLLLKKLHVLSDAKLANLIKPAGFFNVKTKRLRTFFNFLKVQKCNNQLASLQKYSTSDLRDMLLGVSGIGPETSDSILLYALNRPIFVVDAYTRRIFCRHKILDVEAAYDDIQCLFEKNLPNSVEIYNEYHALIVELAKKHCKTRPNCSNCPLKHYQKTI